MHRLMVFLLVISFLIIPVKAEASDKLVALTFDDGPSGHYTAELLDGLAQRGVQATFFLCGYRMEQFPSLTARIHQEGHEIGLHGFSHKSMHTMGLPDILQELRASLTLLPPEAEIAFLRPPGGLTSPSVNTAAKQYHISILNWSVDPQDWAIHDAAVIEKQVMRTVRDGDVILLHDMSDSSVEAALSIIDRLMQEGFRFVTASELARAKGVDPVPGNCYRHFHTVAKENPK